MLVLTAPSSVCEEPGLISVHPTDRDKAPKKIAELASIDEGGDMNPQTFAWASSSDPCFPVILAESGPWWMPVHHPVPPSRTRRRETRRASKDDEPEDEADEVTVPEY